MKPTFQNAKLFFTLFIGLITIVSSAQQSPSVYVKEGNIEMSAYNTDRSDDAFYVRQSVPTNTGSNPFAAESGLENKNGMPQPKIKVISEQFEVSSPVMGFTGKELRGKVYLNWNTGDDALNGIFVIQHSTNGCDFRSVGFKNRIGSQNRLELYYSWADETPSVEEGYYRILGLGDNGSYSYSEVVFIPPVLTNTTRHDDATIPPDAEVFIQKSASVETRQMSGGKLSGPRAEK